MANSPAPALLLRDGDRDELISWTRSTAIRAGLAQRAKILLLAAEKTFRRYTRVELSVNGQLVVAADPVEGDAAVVVADLMRQ